MKKVLMVLAVVSVCSMAMALSVSNETTWTALPDETQVDLNLDKFDTSLGTLTGVTLEVRTKTLGAEVQLDNDSTEAQTGTGKVINTVTFNSTVSTVDSSFQAITGADISVNETQAFELDPTSGDPVGEFNVTTGDDYAEWVPGDIEKFVIQEIADAVWGQYEGTGEEFTLSFTPSMLTGATFDGENGHFEGSSPNAQAFAKVTYEYIPEPMTMALLGLGGLFVRRRSA
ncbi:choice-of-anchor E domain-containing protein [Sedimentisphaera salicampi]|uniref:PEP-CTERM protein-sorting domain-containing protein n=1 Tax=Sedimentisphaera salicampi TaxID=1941349 RepID=A0A1W6LNF5_9BACT|nr:choice-of-anchor E domain-containing protein [Sedimentisphaera salicampi]ARN57315.1 hypothetical protein STSP1_01719 [Sedimentisphaera salicampi]